MHDAAAGAENLLEPRLLALPRSAQNVSVNWIEDVDIQTFGRVREIVPGQVIYRFSSSSTVELEFAVDESDAEMLGFDVHSHFGLREAMVSTSKVLIVEGFITFEEGEPRSIELDSWAALDGDDGHAEWEDPCGCFGSRRDRAPSVDSSTGR